MPRDKRPFITVHDGMPDHPKVDPLSDGAFRLLVTLWCLCSRNKTDGKLSLATWSKRGTSRQRAELVSAGLVELADNHVLMHDYLLHQRSAKEISELSETRRTAGSRGGKAKANRVASATADAKQDGGNGVADTDTERARHTSSSQRARAPKGITSTDDPRFVEFWDVYPRREGKSAALRALSKAVVAGVDAQQIIDGAKRYRDDRNRQPEYTAHAATWLNAGRWDDEPQPQRLHAVPGSPSPRPIDPVTNRPRPATDF